MGMYTELHFNAELRRDVPDDALAVLLYMLAPAKVDNGAVRPEPLPNHPLFATTRWPVMLLCDSYYFDADSHSTLRLDDISNSYFLCVRSNLKNYDGEIEAFIDWIDPFLDKYPGDFLGFSRYEETEEPTLIHKRDPAPAGP